MALKVTTWNLEHARELLPEEDPTDDILDRRRRVRETLDEIAPDILCLVEGPKGEQAITDFCHDVLADQWSPALLKGPNDALGDRDGDYDIRGTQWIWFLIRPQLAPDCRLQAPVVWQDFVGDRRWTVHFWGQEEATRHGHWRHPQVLIVDLGNGSEMELIGVHLKSKINRERIRFDEDGNFTGDYLLEATEARIKLATEARNVRQYIAAKFEQTPNPGLVVLGDCNDGPGHDFFETQYLFFDLVGNLQGVVLLAERLFNHALFDWPAHLRWTARFRDPIRDIPASQNPLLLDHILMSQPLCRGQLPVVANQHAGRVEHEAHERANAGSNSRTRTSDHRPVSCTFHDTE